VDPLQPAAAFPVKPPEQFGVDVDLVFPQLVGQTPLPADHRPHGIAADLELPADLVQRRPRQVQLVNGVTHVRIDHKTLSSFVGGEKQECNRSCGGRLSGVVSDFAAAGRRLRRK
jgi:hypothetical protein